MQRLRHIRQLGPGLTLPYAPAFRERLRAVPDELGLPLIVKPPREGSSIGVSKVKERNALHLAYAEAAKHDPLVIAEKGVMGGEYTVGIVGDEVFTSRFGEGFSGGGGRGRRWSGWP